MATSPLFGWQEPDDTSLVKDGAAAMRTLGNAIDSSMGDLLGGTTGQILSKASNTNMDFTWVTNDVGDITAVTAGTGLTGGGTSGAVTLSIDTGTTVDLSTAQTLTNKTLTSPSLTTPTISTLTTNGDLLYGTGSGAIARRAIGTTGQVLTVTSGVPTWETPASGSTFVGCRIYNNANQSISSSTATALAFQAESFDSDSFHDNTTNNSRITIPTGKTGYYQISAMVLWINRTTYDTVRQLRPYINGVQQNTYSMHWQQNDNSYQVYSDLLYLTAGDYFQMYVWQNDGSAINLLANTSLSFVKVG